MSTVNNLLHGLLIYSHQRNGETEVLPQSFNKFGCYDIYYNHLLNITFLFLLKIQKALVNEVCLLWTLRTVYMVKVLQSLYMKDEGAYFNAWLVNFLGKCLSACNTVSPTPNRKLKYPNSCKYYGHRVSRIPGCTVPYFVHQHEFRMLSQRNINYNSTLKQHEQYVQTLRDNSVNEGGGRFLRCMGFTLVYCKSHLHMIQSSIHRRYINCTSNKRGDNMGNDL